MKKQKEMKKKHKEKTEEGALPDLTNPSWEKDFYEMTRVDLIYTAKTFSYYMIAMSFLLEPLKEMKADLETSIGEPFTLEAYLDRSNYVPFRNEEYRTKLEKRMLETDFLEKDPHIEDPSDREEIKRFINNCEYLSYLNFLTANSLDTIKGKDLILTLTKLKRYNLLTSFHAGLIDGYWMAKRKESERNTKNVSSKSKKKNEIYSIVRDYLDKKLEKDDIKNHIPILMEKTKRGERTIMNMLKEINKKTIK